MVMAVQPHPVDGPVLAAEGAADGQKTLQPPWYAERPMGQEAVIADGDAKTTRDPVEHREGDQGCCTAERRQQGQDGEDMEGGHEADHLPASPWLWRGGGDVARNRCGHGIESDDRIIAIRILIASVAGRAALQCFID